MAEKTRLQFIDLLRGFAIVIMIEVHIFNALIIPSTKEEEWFVILNFINGLVAPSFLFISGFAFIISSQKNLQELRSFKREFWKKLSRILLILLVGYSLHIPFFSIKKLITESSPQQLLGFYNVDVLQNIAVGLLFLFFARLIIKSDKVFYYFILITALFIAVSSPYFWSVDFTSYFPLPLANYFNPMHGSYFPLFPWMAFLLAGAVHCILYLKGKENNEEKRFIRLTLILGIAIVALGHFYLSDIFPESYRSIKPHPVFFFQRLGYVYIFLALCWFYVNTRENINYAFSYIISTGRESLLIYWLHLQIIYRRLWNGKSLESVVGQSFNIFQSIMITLLLIAIMALVAKVWGTFKNRNKKLAFIITTVVLILVTLVFFLNLEI